MECSQTKTGIKIIAKRRNFKKTKYADNWSRLTGLKSYFGNIEIPFDFLNTKKLDYINRLNNLDTPFNRYLSTHTSKKGKLYIKVLSIEVDSQLNFRDEINGDYNYDRFVGELAEQGYSDEEAMEKVSKRLKREKEWRDEAREL